MKMNRAFNGTDSDMFSVVTGILLLFEEKLADFTAYDPSMNAAFVANWKAALNEVVLLSPIHDKEKVITDGALLIDDSDKTLKRCCAKYRDVKYYAGKAFPDNKEALKEFGEGQFSKVRKSRLRMVQFMETLHGVATKYKTELIAKDYTQVAIDEIAALATELREDNNAQQLKKKERPTETRKRIVALNTFYGFGQQASEAAQIVYRDNEVMRGSFRLAKRHHPKVTKTWIVLGVSAVRKIILPKLLKKFKVALTNRGKGAIEYWRADTIRETPAQKFLLAAGESIEIKAEIPAKKFLIMQNTSAKEIRVMMRKENL